MRATVGNLEASLALLQRDLGYFSPRLARALPDFRPRYVPILDKYGRPFKVRRFRDEAAFRVDEKRRQLTFNARSLEMFHAPIRELERSGGITAELADIARHIATEQLPVHEIAHMTVGLVHFSDVPGFKELVGVQALGELDVVADVSAARICARLEMCRAQEKGWATYAARLLQQLYVMGNFAFPAFRSPSDKPHKRQRFLGLAMTAALTEGFLRRNAGPNVSAGEFPLGTPIFPYFDLASGKTLICAFNPDRILWGRAAKSLAKKVVSDFSPL